MRRSAPQREEPRRHIVAVHVEQRRLPMRASIAAPESEGRSTLMNAEISGPPDEPR